MVSRLRILTSDQAAEPEPAAARAPRLRAGSLRVGLVNMPFSSSRMPSIQLGLLQASLRQQGIETHCHYLNLELGAELGWSFYEGMCTRLGAHMVGDWIFSRAAFGDAAPPVAPYLTRHEDALRSLAAELDVELEYFVELRERIAPAFISRCLEQVSWGDYDVVGFTSVFQQNCAALAMARAIKAHHPALVTVFGGGNFEDGKGLEFVRTMPFVDFAVIGEGDVAFPELLAHLAAGERHPRVRGVAFARDGEVMHPGAPAHVSDMDALPGYDYGDFFTAARRVELPASVCGEEVTLPFESARGCWWGQRHHCTFCGIHDEQMAFRAKSGARVLEDLDELARRYGVISFLATDNILEHRYISEVFGPLHEQRKDYRIFYEIKAGLSADQLGALSRGGVRMAQPGIESLNTHILTLMNKGGTGIQQVRLLKWARYYGISLTWHVLRGFPGETEQDYAEQLATMRLIPHLQPPQTSARIRLKRSSPNYDRAEEFGFRNIRALAAYAHIYPQDVDLDEIAFIFDYEAPTTLPDSHHTELDAHIARWRDAWEQARLPTLSYRRGADRIEVTDARIPHAPRIHVLRGVQAQVHEACGRTYQGRAGIRRILAEGAGEPPDPTEVDRALAQLTELGLMLEEDGRFLSLALPVNRYW